MMPTPTVQTIQQNYKDQLVKAGVFEGLADRILAVMTGTTDEPMTADEQNSLTSPQVDLVRQLYQQYWQEVAAHQSQVQSQQSQTEPAQPSSHSLFSRLVLLDQQVRDWGHQPVSMPRHWAIISTLMVFLSLLLASGVIAQVGVQQQLNRANVALRQCQVGGTK